MHSNTTVENDRQKILSKLSKEIDLINREISASTPHFYGVDGKFSKSSWRPTSVGKNPGSHESSIVRRILLDACERSERLSPSSSELTLCLTANICQSMMAESALSDNIIEIANMLQDDCRSISNEVMIEGRDITGKALHNYISGTCNNSSITSLVKIAIKWSGSNSKIEIRKSNVNDASVNIIKGFSFDLTPSAEFVMSGVWEKENVKVLLIDGFIESVSEINRLLENAHTENVPMIIFAREFAHDVISTLSLNLLRGTLNVVPVKVPFDENHANDLKDIASIFGCDVVSSLTGALISKVKLEDLPVAKKVICNKKNVIIHMPTSNSLKSQISELYKKRDTTEQDEKRSLFDKRIKSLTASRTVIEVPFHLSDFTSDIEFIIQSSSALLRCGWIDLRSIKEKAPLRFKTPLEIAINNVRDPHCIPTISLLTALKLSTQAAISMMSIGSLILLDKKC